jgi:hypothetical protein
MAPFVLQVPTDGKTLCLVEFEVKGQQGKLRVDAQGGSNNTARSEWGLAESFGASPTTLNRRIATRLEHLNRQTREAEPNPPADARGMLSIYLTWQPDDDNASLLEGTCAATLLSL